MIEVPAKLMLQAVLGWIERHPNSAFSRFMLRPRGPRSVSRLSPPERLANGLTSLLASAVFVGLALLIAYLGHEKHLYAPDGNLPLFGMFAFTILACMGLVIGLYLLVKVFWRFRLPSGPAPRSLSCVAPLGRGERTNIMAPYRNPTRDWRIKLPQSGRIRLSSGYFA